PTPIRHGTRLGRPSRSVLSDGFACLRSATSDTSGNRSKGRGWCFAVSTRRQRATIPSATMTRTAVTLAARRNPNALVEPLLVRGLKPLRPARSTPHRGGADLVRFHGWPFLVHGRRSDPSRRLRCARSWVGPAGSAIPAF